METKRAGISCLRIIATVAVVFFHTCGILQSNQAIFSLTASQDKFFSIGYHMMYWAVPVFYMISGGVLLNPNKLVSYEKVFKKYILRMVLVLVFFGIPFALLIGFAEEHRISGTMVVQSIFSVLTGKSMSHLWYIYSMIGIYLILPILWRIIKSIGKRDLEVLLLILFVVDFIFPVFSRITGIPVAFNLPIAFHIFYVLAGYYIQCNKPRILSKLSVNAAIGFLYVVIIIGMHNLTNDVERYLAYDSPIIAIMALSLYSLFVMNFKREVSQTWWEIDRLCFAVYLIHPVLIQFCYRVLHRTPTGSFFAMKTIIWWLVFTAISMIGSWLLSRFEFMRKYVL